MSSRCSVCHRPDAQAINAAITRGGPERTVANQFGISKASLHRHKACITEAAAEARQLRAVVSAATASDELARQRHRARKLEKAIDEWMSDPEDPESFTLAPRANEIPVIYVEDEAGKQKRKKALLSVLLQRVEAKLGVTVSYADTAIGDTRRLFIDLMRTTNAHVDLLGKLTGEFIAEKQNPADVSKSGESALLTWLAIAAQNQGLSEPLEATPDNLLQAIESIRKAPNVPDELRAFLDERERVLVRGMDSQLTN